MMSVESTLVALDELFVEYEEQIAESLTLLMMEVADITAQLTGGSVAFAVGLVAVYLAAHHLLARLHSPAFPSRKE